MELKVGSAFSGLGSFDLAFQQAGYSIAWQIENDRHANRVLEKHWPNVRRYGDIQDVNASDLAPVDVIIFGSPCQDLSVAGRRAGLGGKRSGLFFEAVRIIRDCRPAFALWENVPGALSSRGGRDFGAALDALADAGALDICWSILDSQWFGVAQRRRRLFVVADFGGERAAEVLSIPYGCQGDTPPSQEARQRVAASLAASVGSTDDQHAAMIQWSHQGRDLWATPYATSLQASGDMPGQGQVIAVAGSLTAHHGRNDPTEETFIYQCHGSNVGPMGALRAGNGHTTGGVPFVAKPLTAISKGGWRACEENFIPSNLTVRRLTPTEGLRLMALPDDWLDGCKLSDSAKYRLIGNSGVVNVVEWIARRLRQAIMSCETGVGTQPTPVGAGRGG